MGHCSVQEDVIIVDHLLVTLDEAVLGEQLVGNRSVLVELVHPHGEALEGRTLEIADVVGLWITLVTLYNDGIDLLDLLLGLDGLDLLADLVLDFLWNLKVRYCCVNFLLLDCGSKRVELSSCSILKLFKN